MIEPRDARIIFWSTSLAAIAPTTYLLIAYGVGAAAVAWILALLAFVGGYVAEDGDPE